MKKCKKFTALFMSLVLIFSTFASTAITSFAVERDTSSLDWYLDNDNLAVVVETLLTDLDDRKEEIVPTVLNLVFMIEQLKDKAEEEGVDVATADTEDLADVLLAYFDEVLEERDLNSEIKDYKSIIGMILGGVNIDLNSVDGIIETLVVVIDYFNKSGSKTWGDLASLDNSALEVKSGRDTVAISTENSDSTKIVYALIEWLADNTDFFKTVVKGEFSFGSMNGTIETFANLDIEDEVNGMMDNLDVTINEMLYNNLIADWIEVENEDGTTSKEIETAYVDSMYTAYSSDELLAAALVKLITGEDVDQKTASDTAMMTLNELIGKYGDYIIEFYVLEPINNDLKVMLTDLINSNEDLAILKDIINFNYEFDVADFNFTALAGIGIVEGLNDLVCGIIEEFVQPAVAKELALKKGGNENIDDNLTSLCAYVLKTLSAYNGGTLVIEADGNTYSYDYSSFTADKISEMTLEEMIVELVRPFVPSLIGSELPADVDDIEKAVLFVVYNAVGDYMADADESDFTTDYMDTVFNNDGTVKDLSYDTWFETVSMMGMEALIYCLDYGTNFGMSQSDIASFKAEGWTSEDFLDDVVDWALNYIKGFPAVADELDIERGTSDDYGVWYKLNVVINELLPLNFINNCGDETFVFDLYTFINTVVAGVIDCNVESITAMFELNYDPDSLFNQSVISGGLGLVDNLLFSLFAHDCSATAAFTKAATATHDGFEGTYCVDNGHYIYVSVIPATGVTEETTTEESTTIPDEETTTNEQYGACTVHTYDADYIIVTEPTDFTAGIKYRECSVCGYRDIVEWYMDSVSEEVSSEDEYLPTVPSEPVETTTEMQETTTVIPETTTEMQEWVSEEPETFEPTTVPAETAEPPEFVLTASEAEVGGTVTVTVAAKNTKGLQAADIILVYDSECLSYSGYSSHFGSLCSGGVSTPGKFIFNCMYLDCCSSDSETFVEITFDVLEAGDHTVSVSAKSFDGIAIPENVSIIISVHEHAYNAVVTQPTCVQDGYTTYTCSCGDSYVADYVSAAHDYVSVITLPSSTQPGYTTHTCSVCGDSYVSDYVYLQPETTTVPSPSETVTTAPTTEFDSTESGENGEDVTVESITEKDKSTVSDILIHFEDGNVIITNANGEEISADSFVGTGCVIVVNNIVQYNIVIIGDVNGDSTVTAADARMALRASAQLENLENAYFEAANVNGDDKITAADARLILRKSAQLEDF